MARLLALILFGVLAISPASAQTMMQKLTTQAIGNALREAGVASTVGRDNVGDPMLEITPGATPAYAMRVLFFTCAREACEDATLVAYLRPAGGARLERINEWNRTARWTRAYLDTDGDATLELDINATGGIGPAAVVVLVRTFLEQLTKFAKHIDGGI